PAGPTDLPRLHVARGPRFPHPTNIIAILTAGCLHSRRSRISLQRLPVLAEGRQESSASAAYHRPIIRANRIDDGWGLAIGAGQVVRHLMHTSRCCITPIYLALQQRQKVTVVPASAHDGEGSEPHSEVYNFAQTDWGWLGPNAIMGLISFYHHK